MKGLLMYRLVFSLLLSLTVFSEESPGLKLTIKDSTGRIDTRVSRLAALYVKKGTPPTPFLKAGDFTATWEGNISLTKRSRLYFSLRYLKGIKSLSLSINNKEAVKTDGTDGKAIENMLFNESARIRLNKGAHKIKIVLEASGNTDTQFRLYWRASDFAIEPPSPEIFSHTSDDILRTALSARHGRNHVATSLCIKCHKTPEILNENSMPELSDDAPSFKEIGSRIKGAWIAQCIENPKAMRHNAKMPALFKKGDPAIKDIAAFLATLKGGEADLKKGDIKKGGGHFHDLGCINCHTLAKEKDDLANNRIPLKNLNFKYTEQGLYKFIKNPAHYYKSVRMPDFGLTDQQAADITAFLKNQAPMLKVKALVGDAAKGKIAAAKAGCFDCHNDSGLKSTLKAPKLTEFKKFDNSCVTGTNGVNFSFTKADQKNINTFLKGEISSLKQTSLAEYTQRQVKELNCNACHKIDNKASKWSSLHHLSKHLAVAHKGTHGKLDQSRPLLTWAGEKLNTDYLEKIVGGTLGYTTRPWLTSKMPAFKSRAKKLAIGFAHDHGLPANKNDQTPKDKTLDLGKKLVGSQGGYSCVICHDAGPQKALAAFEVKGIDFKYVNDRLRKEYFIRWMLNPLRIVPNSKMPRYSTDDGKTALTNILEGDAEKQYKAIWEYFKQGQKLEKP